MSHTPGPWTANDDPGAGWQIKAKVPQLPEVDHPVSVYHANSLKEFGRGYGDLLIAYEPWVQFPKDWVVKMAEANSRLIAAAPEMLAALEEIAKGAGPYSRDPLEHASNTIEAMKEIARNAITKAEGKSE